MSGEFSPENATPEEYLAYLQVKCSSISLEKMRSLPSLGLPEGFVDKGVESFFDNLNEEKQKQMKALLEKHFSEVLSARVPTSYQEKFFFSILQKFSDEIALIAKEYNLKVLEKIVIGTLPTGEVNALALLVPSGGQIVALNFGLFLFIHLLAKAISEFFPEKAGKDGAVSVSTDEADITQSIRTNREGHLRFVEVLVAYVISGDPSRAPQYFQKGMAHSMLSSAMRSMAEFFVVAHEYSHLILGHVSNKNVVTKKLLDELEVTEIRRNWEEELTADNLALQLTLLHGKKDGLDLALSYLGVDFFFTCIEVVEKASGTGASETHPPSDLRRECLRMWLAEKFGDDSKGALKLAGVSQRIVSELWVKIQPFFEKLRG